MCSSRGCSMKYMTLEGSHLVWQAKGGKVGQFTVRGGGSSVLISGHICASRHRINTFIMV